MTISSLPVFSHTACEPGLSDKAAHILSGCNQVEMVDHENICINLDSLMSLAVFKSIGEDLKSIMPVKDVIPVFYSKSKIINT
jgi:hypothetical protein